MNTRLWLQLTCGRGPCECAYAVPRILKRLVEEAEQQSVSVEVLESVLGRYPSTLYSVLVALDGHGAAAFAERWTGTVCWVGRSPFRPNHKRKNWFISVELFRPPAQIRWQERDLRFETLRSSGPGGQHVNKTESAVRVVHVPTGQAATAREERSQLANRKLALARLAEQFAQREQAGKDAVQQQRWQQHDAIERGRPKRTFVGEAFEEK